MTCRVFEKDGRKIAFVFNHTKVFVGTVGHLSSFAAQEITKEIMSQLNWKRTGTYRDIIIDDDLAIGLGYKIPLFTNRKKAFAKLFAV